MPSIMYVNAAAGTASTIDPIARHRRTRLYPPEANRMMKPTVTNKPTMTEIKLGMNFCIHRRDTESQRINPEKNPCNPRSSALKRFSTLFTITFVVPQPRTSAPLDSVMPHLTPPSAHHACRADQ